MNAQRKKQIAWWAQKVYEQAQEYADVADPNRTRSSSIGNRLDAITRLAQEIHWELTGKLPKEAA